MSEQSQGPGWWVASDGKWYPPHLHPDYRPADGTPSTEPPPTVVAARTEPIQDATDVLSPDAPTPGRPPGRRTLASDLAALWHEKRGLRIAVVAGGVLVVLAVIGALVGGNGKTAKVRTGATTSLPTTTLHVTTTPATAAATTSTTPATSSTPATSATSTTVARATTTAPVPSTTTPAATTAPTTGVASTSRSAVTAGAFCSPEGAAGVTSTGKAMACTTTAADGRTRWRAV